VVADPLDPFLIKQGLDRLVGWPLGPRMALAYLRAARAARRVWLPMLWERSSPAPSPEGVLPSPRPLPGGHLKGRRVGLVVSGGSGNLAATCGVVRAIEEAGGTIAAVAGCSGGSLWAAQVAMGMGSERMVRFSLDGLDPRRYLELQPVRSAWRTAVTGRAFTGVIQGERIEAMFDDLGAGRLDELPVPFYSILWELETNRLIYAGSRTTPDWTLGQAVRGSLSLAPAVEPWEMAGRHYVDGGVVNVLPVAPLLEHHPEIEVFVAINGFLPDRFIGPDLTGWQRGRLGMLLAARQLQMAPFQELARREWASIADRAWLVEPIGAEQAYGVNFFAAMIDRDVWPDRMRAGHREARRVLSRPPG
jgi:NTE family protein